MSRIACGSSPPLVGAVGMFPERLREGVLLCVLVKWALSCERGVLAGVLTLWGWRARRFCVFRLVALGILGEGSQALVGVGGIASP